MAPCWSPDSTVFFGSISRLFGSLVSLMPNTQVHGQIYKKKMITKSERNIERIMNAFSYHNLCEETRAPGVLFKMIQFDQTIPILVLQDERFSLCCYMSMVKKLWNQGKIEQEIYLIQGRCNFISHRNSLLVEKKLTDFYQCSGVFCMWIVVC